MDIAMLRWIATIRSLNPELRYIRGKDNTMADMLSRARYEGDEEIEAKDDMQDAFLFQMELDGMFFLFQEESYERELKHIGQYLNRLEKLSEWLEKMSKKIRHKTYGYFLKDGYLWKKPKRKDRVPLRVVGDRETKYKIMKDLHDSLWAGYRGIWATYMKIKERYW